MIKKVAYEVTRRVPQIIIRCDCAMRAAFREPCVY